MLLRDCDPKKRNSLPSDIHHIQSLPCLQNCVKNSPLQTIRHQSILSSVFLFAFPPPPPLKYFPLLLITFFCVSVCVHMHMCVCVYCVWIWKRLMLTWLFMCLCTGEERASTNIFFECDYEAGNGKPEELPVSLFDSFDCIRLCGFQPVQAVQSFSFVAWFSLSCHFGNFHWSCSAEHSF